VSGLSGCILGSTYVMKATLLRQYATGTGQINPAYYQVKQDPISGEIIREWNDTDPDVPSQVAIDIPCMVEGIIDGGIRVAGTTERWGEHYDNIDWVRMEFPSSYIVTKRDRITNIRNAKTNQAIWVEEETAGTNGVMVPTIFEVIGVTPVTDPFGRNGQNLALLQRAEVQSG